MSNPRDISVSINGLVPLDKYSFNFTSIGGNWPVVVTPISGSFIANAASGKIDATVYFCSSKNDCDDCQGLLSYQECLCGIGDDKFTKLQLRFFNQNEPANVFSSRAAKIICSGCFPVINISVSDGNMVKKDTEKNIDIEFSNLIPNKTYNYLIQNVESSWPFSLSSTSGMIHANNKTESLTLYGGFCATTGSCPNGQSNVFPYTIKNNVGNKKWYKTETSFRLLLSDYDCPSIVYYSDIVNIRCLDCIPSGTNVGVGVTINEGISC
jgi:hypothetical protein